MLIGRQYSSDFMYLLFKFCLNSIKIEKKKRKYNQIYPSGVHSLTLKVFIAANCRIKFFYKIKNFLYRKNREKIKTNVLK